MSPSISIGVMLWKVHIFAYPKFIQQHAHPLYLLIGWTYWFLIEWAKLYDLQLDQNILTLQMWCFGVLVGNVITL
jgi:hypothetical protein